MQPKYVAQIQDINAINATQPEFSTQTKKVIKPNFQRDEAAPVHHTLTTKPELNMSSSGEIQDKSQNVKKLQEHLHKLSTIGQFERASPSFKMGTKRKYQEVTRRSDVTPLKKSEEKNYYLNPTVSKDANSSLEFCDLLNTRFSTMIQSICTSCNQNRKSNKGK